MTSMLLSNKFNRKKTASKKTRARADLAFLPGALSVIETPASPLAGTTVAAICLFFVVAVAWACIGQIDVIAVAQGKVQPVGRIKTVQSFTSGRLQEVFVQNGDKVRKGDLLFRLDSQQAAAEHSAVLDELANFKAEAARRQKAIDFANGDPSAPFPDIEFDDDIPAGLRKRKTQSMQADIAAYQSSISQLDLQQAEKKAEQRKLVDTIAAERAMLDIMSKRVDFFNHMLASGFGGRKELFDAEESLEQKKAALVQDMGQLMQIQANLDILDHSKDVTKKKFIEENANEFDDAQRQIELDQKKLERASWDLQQTSILSPADGIVQSSILTTSQQVISAGDEVMRIVPDDVKFEVESYLPNSDIGFVKPEQAATIKIESFPFTRYGTINATVKRVGKDAIPEPDASSLEQNQAGHYADLRTGADRVQNLVYPVTLELEKLSMDIDGSMVPLRAGMAVTVEIKTAQRRLIDYVLSPLKRMQSEMLHER